MLKEDKVRSLNSAVAVRFVLSYVLVFSAIASLMVYILTSKIDEVKYNLRSYNLEIQNTINASFNEIERQLEFYERVVGSHKNFDIFENIDESDTDAFFNAIYILDDNSTILYKKQKNSHHSINFDLPWLDTLKHKRYIVSDLMFENRELKTFFVAYDMSDGLKMVAEVNVNYIVENVSTLLNEKNKIAYVVDYNGNYILGKKDTQNNGLGYNKAHFSDPSVVDQMFVDNRDIIFNLLNMKISLFDYMDNHNFFVVTESIKDNAVMARFLLLFFGFLAIVAYTTFTISNVKYVKNTFLNPSAEIIDFLKNKDKKPNTSKFVSEFITIVNSVDLLYADIEKANLNFYNYKSRFGYIFEKSPLLILVYDAYTGDIVDASNQALKFYGYTYSEIKSINVSEIFGASFESSILQRMENSNSDNRQSSVKTIHRTKNGDLKNVISKAGVIQTNDEKYIFLIVEDITCDTKVKTNDDIIQALMSEHSAVLMVADKQKPFLIKYATKNVQNIFDMDYSSVIDGVFDLRDIICQNDKISFVNEIELNKRLFSTISNAKNNITLILKMITASNVVLPFKVNVKFLKNSSGKFDSIAYYISDYADQQASQDKYEAEIRHYKNIIWATNAATIEYNAQNNTLKANSIFANMLGYTNLNDMTIDYDMMNSMLVDDFNGFDAFFNAIEIEKGVYFGDVRVYSVDRHIIWLHIHAKIIEFGDNNTPLIISGIAENVTDKKIAFVYQDLAARLFSYSKESIVIFDAKWNIIDSNTELSNTSGYLRDELLGSNISLLKSKLNDADDYANALETTDKFGSWHGKLWFKHKNGEDYLESVNLTSLSDSNGVTMCYVGIMSSMSNSSSTQDYLEHIAYHDPLTKLPNRFLFSQKLEEAIRTARGGKKIAIAYLDMDGFKGINDTYGHKAGDKFLTEISANIDILFDERDMFARIGGDEFVAIIVYENPGQVYEIVENMLSIASGEVYYDETIRLSISASIGVSMRGTDNMVSPENLLEQADWAMYQAKLSGKNRYYVFDNTKDRHFKSQYEDNTKILTALENNEFFLEYQPEIDIKTNEVIAYEALLRWKKDGKVVYPNDFFPLIKRQNVIDDLAFFSLKSALKDQSEWRKRGINASVCVNLSIEQICKDKFFENFKELIENNENLNPRHLNIEIIDANSTPSLEYASKFLQKYKRFGVKFILDDFASRSSSFDALELLPIDKIKIDKNICSYMFFNKKAFITVRMLKNLSDIFGKTATIKNLKDISTLRVLIGLGFHTFQGNFFEKPMLLERILDYKFNGIDGVELTTHIDDEKFEILKDCIMLKEYAQNIITHIINKDFNSDEDSFEGMKKEMLLRLQSEKNYHKEITEHIIESLTTSDRAKSLQLARLANIMCMKILDLGSRQKEIS